MKEGLCRMARNHIHFAAAMPGEDGVISGMRGSCQVSIYVNAQVRDLGSERAVELATHNRALVSMHAN